MRGPRVRAGGTGGVFRDGVKGRAGKATGRGGRGEGGKGVEEKVCGECDVESGGGFWGVACAEGEEGDGVGDCGKRLMPLGSCVFV